MKKLYLLISCLICFFFFNIAMGQFAGLDGQSSKIGGIVFNDINKNRKYDNFEKGISGVLVSNSTEIVVTDENGRYSIEAFDGESIVFVIKPPAWNVPHSNNNLPQFFHNLQNEEQTESLLPGSKSGGRLSESIDFPLYKTETKDTFEFIAFADPQSRKLIELYYMRDDVVSELIHTKADFGITLGDIMYDDLSLFDRHNDIISKIGIPFYNVAGNHDMDYSAPDDRDALKTFKQVYGPSYYAFEYGIVNFIVLDDVEWTGKSETNAGSYRGFLGEKQLEWIQNYLKFVPTDHLIIIAMHIPLFYSGSTDEVVNVADRKLLFDIMKGYENVLVIAGHMHMIEHSFIGEDLGWRNKQKLHHITCSAVSGSWWTGPKDEKGIPETLQRDGVPNGYHIFTIEGNTYKEYHKVAGMKKDYQMRLVYPFDKIKLTELDTMQIIVNVFNGSERSTVKYSIDGGEAVKMVQTVMEDPYIIEAFTKAKSQYPKSLQALKSKHIWTADFPSDLSQGSHSISITTVDLYGTWYIATTEFEIE
ncbi:MAG: calcineurin-like phosphoesterase family protein [Bacteroidales bacterium]|nr:calcineurin-like phosphoesterase family protein [Bacteroidales bacterium]